MKKYKATVGSKSLQKGMLSVSVQFTNGEDTFNEAFETNQAQDENWLAEQVGRKLKHLNAIQEMFPAITEGPVTEKPPVDAASKLSAKEQYGLDLARFEKFIAAMSKGFITQDNEDFKALKQKLTDDFDPEYLDLFAG